MRPTGRPDAGLTFDPAALPKPQDGRRPELQLRQTAEQLQKLEVELRARDEKLATILAGEAETRDYFIDLLLKEAGWACALYFRPGAMLQRWSKKLKITTT